VNVIASRLARTRTWRAWTIGALGPSTATAGFIWAVIQPYRLTILHPHGQGLWWLVAEPQLWVLLVGLLFAWLVAPGLIEDLDAAER
jgi:hypothetical protein